MFHGKSESIKNFFGTIYRDDWLACMRSTFEGLDIDHDGLIGSEQLVELLREKLPEEEVGPITHLHECMEVARGN